MNFSSFWCFKKSTMQAGVKTISSHVVEESIGNKAIIFESRIIVERTSDIKQRRRLCEDGFAEDGDCFFLLQICLDDYFTIGNEIHCLFGYLKCVYRFTLLALGAGVDYVREQRKLEARKMYENSSKSPASGVHFVRVQFDLKTLLGIKEPKF